MRRQNFEQSQVQGLIGRGMKPKVIRQTQNIQIDANRLAEVQQQRSRQQQLIKKQKIESFMNETKIKASKIQKQISMKTNDDKKIFLDKQKQLKNKYTIVKKDPDSKQKIANEPMKVQWKKAENLFVKVPQEVHKEQESDDNSDQIDSEYEQQKSGNPQQLLRMKQQIRKRMLNKKM